MGIFRKGELLGAGAAGAGPVSVAARRFKIRITTEDGAVVYWHKRGELHLVEEDVARIFVANFKPELFQALPDGHLTPPAPGKTLPIRRVEMEPA